MSTVDDRVVRLQFDNAQFEAGVMRSMKTLDTLNEKLQFKEAAKGLSSLMVAVEGVSSKSLQVGINALDRLSSYSTTVLGMIAQKVKTQFADKIVNAIEAIPQRAMSQIKSGGWNRAMNIANAKFQIEGLKYSWDAVREAADYAVTDTAYGLDSAAKAASQLAASGVDFEKIIGKDGAGKDVTQMHRSLRAISGVAAMTNASYDDIAHTFTRIAGQGRVMANDLNSLASRGLNAAATLAQALGTTEAEVRDMVSKGAIDFQMFSEAMDEAYGDHAKEANKTFTGSLSNMKAALSRIGAIFTQPVIDKTNTFFVAVTSRIKEFQKALNDTTDADGKKTLRFAGHFAEAWESGVNAASKFVEALNLDWFQTIGKNLDKLAIKAKTVFDGVNTWFDKAKNAADKLESIGEKAKMTVEDLALVEAVIRGDYGDGLVRINEFAKKGLNYDRIQGFVNEAAKVDYNLKQLGWTVEDLNKETEEAVKNGNEAELRAERLSKTVGNLFNSLKYGRDTVVNFGGAVKTILTTAINNLTTSMAGPLVMSRRIAEFTHSLSTFTKELQPTESMLRAVAVAVNEVGTDFTNLTDKIMTTATAIVKFAAEALRSEKTLEELAASDKLTPLQSSVLSVMRVIKNLGRVVGNVASSIYKIIRAVVKGLGKAFNPSGVLGGVADFSEGLANLTEKFKITDEAASVIETVFEGLGKVIMTVAGAVSKVVGGIVKFISSIGKAKNPTNQVADTLEKVEETGEKTASVFDNLKKVFETIGKKIKELPTKFQELKDAVDQQEGVIHLKESFDKLKTSIKESLEKMKPFKKDIEEVGEAAGGTGETAIGKLASGIGIVAGKLADFIDKLPTWGTKIEEFWNNVKTTVETWISNIHLDKFFDNLGDGVTEFFTSDESIIGKIKTFAKTIFDSVCLALEDVDWKKVGKGSILALIGANLFNFFKITSGVESTIKGFAAIPKSIGKIFTELSTVFGTANKSLKKITNAYIFSSIVSSMMLLVSAVIILGEMDQNELKQGIAAVIWLSVAMAIIGKAIGKILGEGDRYFNKQNIKEVDKSQKNLLQINNKLGGLIGAGIMLAGLGAAMWLVMQGLLAVSKEWKKNAEGIKGAVEVMKTIALVIIGAFAVIAIISAVANKVSKGGDKLLGTLFGAGVLLAGLGAAMYLFTHVFISLAHDLEGLDAKRVGTAFTITLTIMLLLTGFTFAAGKALEKADWKSLGMMAVVMVLAVALVGVIALEVVGLAWLLETVQDKVPGDTVIAALGIMASIMFSVGLMVYLMGRGLADVDHPGALIGLVFMMGLFVAAVAAAIILMGKAIHDYSIDAEALKTAILGMVGIIAVVGGVTFAIAALANNKFQGADRVRDTLISIGLVFALVGVMAVLIAEAISMIGDAKASAVGVMVAFVVAALTAMLLISKMAIKSKGNGEDIGQALFGVALAFVGIAAACLIVAAAIKLLSTVAFEPGLLFALGTIVVALLAFVGMGYLLAKSGLDESFEKISKSILTLGLTFLAAGAGIWLAAKGIEALVATTAGLVNLIKSVGDAFAEHPLIFILVTVALIALIALVYSITKHIGPLVDTVITAVTKLIDFVLNGAERLAGGLKTGGKKISSGISNWWGNLQPRLKIGIVTGIATLCAAILKATPEMLKTIKALIKKVIFFLVDIIPTVIDGLVEILLRIINGLADSIRKNSARIAYAFWNLIESLLEVLIDVLLEGLGILGSGIMKALGLDEKADMWIETMKETATAEKAALRGGLASMKEYSETSEDTLRSLTGLDESMNKIAEDTTKEAEAYENTTAMLEKYKGEARAAGKEAKKSGGILEGVVDTVKDKVSGGGEIGFDLSAAGLDTRNLVNLDNQVPGLENLDTSTFMEGQGYDESQINFEAAEGGEGYTDAWASGMTTPEAQGEIQSAVVDNVGVVQDELEAHKDELGKSADKGIIVPIRNKMNLANADFKNEGEKWFKSTAEGYQEGFNKYSKDHLKYMAQFGSEVDKSFRSKKGIDSNSPSKKFYKSGLWCILGIQQAIKDNSYLATGQMEDLGGSMVDAVGGSLDYVSKIASGDIEYDPRIRPVMDLSNVGRTATDVSSMFANQNVTLSGISGQIAYDMTNLNGSNAAVVSELQALREDMNAMTDELTNMQIVMDTGALVGSTVGAYDEAFGRRAAYGERGN